jgi:hypothetical protein
MRIGTFLLLIVASIFSSILIFKDLKIEDRLLMIFTMQMAFYIHNIAFKEYDIHRLKEEIRGNNTKYIAANNWVAYNFDVTSSRPKNYGKYLVCRKDGKIHMETWNGSGWAYNSNVIEYYMLITNPKEYSNSTNDDY